MNENAKERAVRMGRTRRVRTAVAVVALALASVVVWSSASSVDAAQTYTSLPQPRRILETRPGLNTCDGQFNAIGARAARSTLRLQVGGRAGVPANATAVVLNVTATQAATNGFAVLFPCGESRPNASSINFGSGRSIANAVIAKLGNGGGDVCLYANQRAHFVIDVSGFFPTGTYSPLARPQWLLETRPALTTADGKFNGIGRRSARSTLQLQVTGRAGVPANAGVVALNLTSTQSTKGGYGTLYPCGEPRSNASNVNFGANQTIAVAAIVKVGAGGKVCLYTPSHFVIDVSGVVPGTTYTPLAAPRRILESRGGLSTFDGKFNGIGRRGAGTSLRLDVAGRAGVPATASAVELTLTPVDGLANGFSTVFPRGVNRPNASHVNYTPGEAIANLVVAKIGAAGDMCVFTNQGAHFVVDVAGYLDGPLRRHRGAAALSRPSRSRRPATRAIPPCASHRPHRT